MHRRHFQSASGGDHPPSARMPTSGLNPAKAGSKHPLWTNFVAPMVAVMLGVLALGGCVVSEHTHGEHGSGGEG